MFVVESVRHRYIDVVPAVISSLVATDQQNRTAARIEGVERSIGAAFGLRPELTHMTVSGAIDPTAVRKAQVQKQILEQLH